MRYLHRKLLLDGKFLVRETDAQSSKATPDVAAIRGKLTPFVQTLDDAKALVATEKKSKNSEALYQGGYEQLLTKAGWYKDAVNELLRQLETPSKEKQSAIDERRKRAVEQVIKSYNAVIELEQRRLHEEYEVAARPRQFRASDPATALVLLSMDPFVEKDRADYHP